MTILANAFDRQWEDCRAASLAAAERVGASGWYILGREVAAFEANLARHCGRAHAIGCANGLDAIEIALRVCGLDPGDRVLTTPLSAFATALAVLRAGGEPVFCDVDEDGLIAPSEIEKALAADPAIRFILPVHLYGRMADMRAIRRLAERTGAIIIEDAAQAIGAARDGLKVGDAGRFACLSFYPTKNLGALGDGGALLTDDGDLAEMAKSLRNYGQTEKYVHAHQGLNSRLDELQAAIMNDAHLPRLEAWTARRRAIAERYLDGVDSAHVRVAAGAALQASVWHLFPVFVDRARRDAFITHLKAAGVQAGIHYPSLMSDQAALLERGAPIIAAGGVARASRIAAEEVSLPIHPYLSDAEADAVIGAVNAWAG